MEHKRQLGQTPGQIFVATYTQKGRGKKPETGFVLKVEGNAKSARLIVSTGKPGVSKVIKPDASLKEIHAARQLAQKSGEFTTDLTRKGLASSGAIIDAIFHKLPPRPKQNRSPSRLPG